MLRLNKSLLAFFFFPSALLAQQPSPLPALPGDIPKDAVVRMMLTGKTPSGQDAVWKSPDGTIHEFFQFNDRGRGPKIYTPYRLDQRGLIVFEESNGVDYMKTPVGERFSMKAGDAEWKNQSENEKQSDASGKFFVGILIVAGTDNSNGYALDRELEIYADAGVPAPEVLRIATIEAAQVMHMEKDFGSVAPGKYADMILINGDPTKQISDIRHVDTVIKNGVVYKPTELYPAFGIRAE